MITIHDKVEQGTPEWHRLRSGIITASECHKLVSDTGKLRKGDGVATYLQTLVGHRLLPDLMPQEIQTFDMARGHEEEKLARALYADKCAVDVAEVGIIHNDDLGFRIGYSPDGLVGDDGLIEVKSKAAKYHIPVIISGEVPLEHMVQIQFGIFASGRKWCDYIQYSNGLPMFMKRVEADTDLICTIKEACNKAEEEMRCMIDLFCERSSKFPKTQLTITHQI